VSTTSFDSHSGPNGASSWNHAADADDRSLWVGFQMYHSGGGAVHSISAVTYGNKPLTLRQNADNSRTHVCTWTLDDIDGRDDDVIRVTGSSFGFGNGQYSGHSILMGNPDHRVKWQTGDSRVASHTDSIVNVNPGSVQGIWCAAAVQQWDVNSGIVSNLNELQRDSGTGPAWCVRHAGYLSATGSQNVGFTSFGNACEHAQGADVFIEGDAIVLALGRAQAIILA
jgi:hypothetical protein